MAGNARRVIAIGGAAILGGLVLDNWTGANALSGTFFSGVSNVASGLRTGKATPTHTPSVKAG